MTYQLFLGDTIEQMSKLPDQSIDMILCDLPYGTTACKWDTIIPFDKLWEQYNRICKKNAAIVLTSDGIFTGELMLSNEKIFRYKLIWDKKSTTGFFNANSAPLRRHEDILVFYKAPPTYKHITLKWKLEEGHGKRVVV